VPYPALKIRRTRAAIFNHVGEGPGAHGRRAGDGRASMKWKEWRGRTGYVGGTASGARIWSAAGVHQLHACLLTIREQALPKSEAANPLVTRLNNWVALKGHCGDAAPFCGGAQCLDLFRKRQGGRAAAVLRSFVTSCEVEIRFARFKDVLTSCPIDGLSQVHTS
jgi:hypothetical protein